MSGGSIIVEPPVLNETIGLCNKLFLSSALVYTEFDMLMGEKFNSVKSGQLSVCSGHTDSSSLPALWLWLQRFHPVITVVWVLRHLSPSWVGMLPMTTLTGGGACGA